MKISEISKFLQDNYSFFGKNIGIKTLDQKESNNQNFLISSKKEKFVLHIINENIRATQIEKICKILKFCNDEGAKVQLPIKNTKGKFVNEKLFAYLTRYTDGKPSSGKNSELINLAKHLAKLHSVLAKCKIPYTFRMNRSFYQILDQKEIKKIKNIINKKSKKNVFDKNVSKNQFSYCAALYAKQLNHCIHYITNKCKWPSPAHACSDVRANHASGSQYFYNR